MSGRGAKWVDKALVHSAAYIGVCTSEAQYRYECKRMGVPGEDWIPKGADGCCRVLEHPKSGATAIIVCVRPRGKRTRAAFAAIIVHEAVHAWQHIREDIGETNPSSEFEAYSVQSICQRLFEAVGL